MHSALIAFTTLSFVSANERMLNDVVSGLEKGTFFFENTFDRINLDALIGFRVLQAQLEDALKRWSLSGPEAISQRAKVDSLVRRLDFTAIKSTKEIKANDPEYFHAFEQMLHTHFWTLNPGWKQTKAKLVYRELRDAKCFGEDFSDKCLSQLLGTWKNGVPCWETDICKRLMTTLHCQDYSLSHQLLYFMIAENKRCSNIVGAPHMESKASLTVQDYKEMFCSNMMRRNLEIENDNFPLMLQDLFLENIFFCGLAGFSDFYKVRWLETILMWQQPTGCFGISRNSTYLPMEKLYAITQHKRVKRRDRTLKGCSTHMTCIAVGALGGYLRFYGISQNITEPPEV
uniref:UPF0764 protein C16orf89 homolog n=1 Tax=Pristiophorus japonicus TaxID=55135 RepID=UPI00398EB4B1